VLFQIADRLDVEVVRRLVEQQHVGVDDESARQEHAALGAGRERVDERVLLEAELRDDLVRARVDHRLVGEDQAAGLEGRLDFFREDRGAAALLAFVLVSAPLLQQPQDDGMGEGEGAQPMQPPVQPPRQGQSKSMPKGVQGGAVVVAAEPEQAALRLQLALSAQGVSSALQRDGAGWRLTAGLPAAARAALEPELQAQGLAWPADGQLNARFVKPQ